MNIRKENSITIFIPHPLETLKKRQNICRPTGEQNEKTLYFDRTLGSYLTTLP